MKRIYFRNTAGMENCKVCLLGASDRKQAFLAERDGEGDFVIEFDEERFDGIYFEGVNGEKTGVVYPGKLSLGIEYKYNEGQKKNLTYLFVKEGKNGGRVDNYVLCDAQRLSHREDKSKKISVFVPESYDGVTPHDILYFFDAQNLFGAAGHYTENGDPYGSWQLDTVITELKRQFGENIIVVGIDNADAYRDRELFMDPQKFGALAPLATALPDEDYSVGYLDEISEFMTVTLHSFIKERYCVKEDNIGVGGASMGGIAAFYCGLRERGFYRYVLSYSPAFGLYEMSAFEDYFAACDFGRALEELPKIHVYCGEGDPLERLLIGPSRAMKGALERYGYPEEKIFETYDGEKPHNEESWRLILAQSFSYLLKGAVSFSEEQKPLNRIK